jgi:hypothetical protein
MENRQWGFTPAGTSYPPFLNVTEQDDGSFIVTVRSPATFDGRCGNDAGIAICRDDFRLYIKKLAAEIDR